MTDFAVNRRSGIVSLLVNFVLIAFLLVLWLLSSFVLIANSDSGPASDGYAVFQFACVGFYFSRWAIAALLLVLLPGSLWLRSLIAVMVFGSEAIAMAFFGPSDSEPILMLLLVPMLLFSICLPFEVARVVWNFRLDVDWFDFVERRQMGVKVMLGWVTAAAIVVGLVRTTEKEMALAFFGSGVLFSTITAVFVLPFTIRVMKGSHRLIRFFVILIITILIAVGITFLSEKVSGPLNGFQRAFFPTAIAAFLTSYGLSLFLLQRIGMRLESG